MPHLEANSFHLYLALHSVAGPIITLVGFQVHLTVSLKIVISTNNSQCISLVTEETKTDVNKVSLRMLET